MNEINQKAVDLIKKTLPSQYIRHCEPRKRRGNPEGNTVKSGLLRFRSQ